MYKKQYGVNFIRSALLVLTALWLFGCGESKPDVPVKGPEAEAYIKERVEKRWDALAQSRFDLAYGYETPTFRKTYSEASFRSKYGTHVRWLGAKAKNAKIEGEVADIGVYIEHMVINADGSAFKSETPIREKWIFTEGDWWFLRK